jgi:hypothetical protein
MGKSGPSIISPAAVNRLDDRIGLQVKNYHVVHRLTEKVQVRKDSLWKLEPSEQEISHKHSQSGH